jgi:hypothetical protein
MKTMAGLVWLTVLSGSVALGQLRITSLDRTLRLQWTNAICTENPVYEVLKANSPTGTWSHVSFVTNRNEIVIDDPVAHTATATFYRLAWTSDEPLEFDYFFDEGYGFIAVIGRLAVTFSSAPNAGTWTCAETDYFFDERHPLGTGVLWGGQMTSGNLLRLELRTNPGGCLDCGFYLEGVLEQSMVNGKCTYTRYTGLVFEQSIAGPEEIGDFVAIRR